MYMYNSPIARWPLTYSSLLVAIFSPAKPYCCVAFDCVSAALHGYMLRYSVHKMSGEVLYVSSSMSEQAMWCLVLGPRRCRSLNCALHSYSPFSYDSAKLKTRLLTCYFDEKIEIACTRTRRQLQKLWLV